MESITAVILAGGVGRRFSPFAGNKTMFSFFGKPLLQHTIEAVAAAGFSRILVAVNSENASLVEELTKHSAIPIHSVMQEHPYGMGNAMDALRTEIGENPCVVLNAVDYFDSSLYSSLIHRIQADNPYALIVGKTMESYFSGGYIVIKDDKVVGVIEKPKPDQRPSNIVKLVCDYFSKPQEFLAFISPVDSRHDDQYEHALTKLMSEKPCSLMTYEGTWTKLNYAHTVLAMMEDMFAHHARSFVHESAKVSPQATISGLVYIDEGAQIFEGAVIKGPCYIGKKVIIGNHTLIRHSMIEAEAVIGFGSEIGRSYIGPRCKLHHNYIGDSVLESDINPSYGTCTANMRLDNQTILMQLPNERVDSGRSKLGAMIAKNVFCGINCSLMPGITIGENAKIYPGVVVNRAIKANEVVRK